MGAIMSQLGPGYTPPPMPASPLPYSTPARQNRPGIITAIGVLCIVVACLSGLFSLVIGLESMAFFIMSKASVMMSTPMSVATVSASAQPAASGKLKSDEAPAADNALQSMLALDGAHVRELDKLLRTHGREIFGTDEDTSLTASAVRDAITEKTPLASSTSGLASFVTASGKVEIYPDRAQFISTDGSTTIRTSVANSSESTNYSTSVTATATAPGTSGSPSTTLTAAQVNQVIAAVQGMAKPPLSPAQVTGLRTALSAPNQQLLTPGATPPITFAVAPKGQNATIQFNGGGMLTLGPTGQIVSSSMTGFPGFKVNLAAVVLVMAEAAASVALAIYLLVVGILLFRESMRTPLLLRIFALLKIPLALAAGAGMAWMGYTFVQSFAGMAPPGSGPGASVFIIWGCVVAVLGLAFPIGVLIALRTRTVRAYYNTIAM